MTMRIILRMHFGFGISWGFRGRCIKYAEYARAGAGGGECGGCVATIETSNRVG